MSRCFPNLKMIILDHWDENKKSVTWRIERKIYLLCSNKEKHHPHEIERLNYWYQPLIETIEFCNSCCHHRSCNHNKLMLNVYTYICIIFIFPPSQTVFFFNELISRRQNSCLYFIFCVTSHWIWMKEGKGNKKPTFWKSNITKQMCIWFKGKGLYIYIWHLNV